MNARRLVVLGLAAAITLPAMAVKPGEMAPDFKGTDSNGKTQSVSQYKGKWVVLEWHNQGCPYEQKHYLSGNMESLQKEWTGKGVVWLSIISSARGEQGYVTPAEENEYIRKMKVAATAVVLDPAGKIGHEYEAKTTPHMFVINPEGKVVYMGAIDDQPSPDPSTLKGARNYLNEALTAGMAGKPVAVAATRPYGCSVKYAE
ncbi:redoxin domain-containing protein [Terriglobus tenax]|uniref:redoxin domain-containing protein n=1 Tax=Terriglobus tenax TaxID=1111115 RepID=UPI0021DFFD38|nr:redoxin domain-containing protein [Terriglobus tenax]